MKPFQAAIVRNILRDYQFDQPFHKYFATLSRANRAWGSRDRKIYRQACYAFLRCAQKFQGDISIENIEAAMAIVKSREGILAEEIFRDQSLISDALDAGQWSLSHLVQKPVYLRLRKGKQEEVRQWLNLQQMELEWLDGDKALKVAADAKCDELIERGLAWVMDYGSQMIASEVALNSGDQVWDACAGAGGKSLFIRNEFGDNFKLVCSDKRLSVLQNLEERFSRLKMKLPNTLTADLTEEFHVSDKYDKIILDVPCTGSGTWGRSPESLQNFQTSLPQKYALVQKAIFRNAIKRLKEVGTIYYMTCSVFKAENEENVAHFELNHGLKCIESSYRFLSYETSDVLFIAKLKRV